MSCSSRLRGLSCWLFVEGADPSALEQVGTSEADALIQKLEDFTPPQLRPRARELCAGVLARAEPIVDAFEHAQAQGLGRVEVDGSMVELPIYQNARGLLARRRK